MTHNNCWILDYSRLQLYLNTERKMGHFKWCQHQQGTLQRDVDSFALLTNRGMAMPSNVMLHILVG